MTNVRVGEITISSANPPIPVISELGGRPFHFDAMAYERQSAS